MSHDHHGRCHHNAYRMSCEDFDALYLFAKGQCQICQTPEAETVRRMLVIDHDPRYAPIAVRGLLCDGCNSLMRRFDAGQSLDPRCFTYRRRAWFMRALIARRETQFETVRAKERADEKGETVSEAVRKFLERYAK